MKNKRIAVVFAIAAAALYAINIPLSKLLLIEVDTTMMAAFLYLGAGIGMLIYSAGGKLAGKQKKRELLTRKELPYTVAMVRIKNGEIGCVKIIKQRFWGII